ncbi:hypothetical protein [Rhodovulum euryhalinum]|uniref:Uncharacterized protein n=1 Tax=Rhodovulum euryhalinum TaxID=35805 RepID=A0A4R2KNI0_9RHOB|nr:hypothetical protein [Rhodovulum euryhalinum]TCO71628.1 hypothetical protein EV655_106120 [Rhodovulum euryhalinum]
MPSEPNTPVLLAYLNGMPDVESTYPVLARLHARGRVRVRALVYSKVLRKEPRLAEAFAKNGFTPEPASKLRMKFFFQQDIIEADAILTIADASWDTTSRRRRSNFIRSMKKRSYFIQHGAYQLGINGSRPNNIPMEFYSQHLLFWEPIGKNHIGVSDRFSDRVSVVGFTKQNILPPRSWGAEVTDWVARHPRRLLVCQSFRWGNGRYSADHIDHFYALMDAALTRHPDLGIVIRSHRGKVRRNHRAHDRALRARHPNVLFSHYYSGPLAKATIHDALDLCHAMVSPTSTTVLDCVYRGKPAAVFAENLDIFPDLPQIDGIEALEAFLSQIDNPGPEQAALRDRFGAFDDNLDRAAAAIERTLLEAA